MKVLVACEESQAVCKAFRQKGHEAYSADLQECSGGHPEWHIRGDVLPLIDGNCTFMTDGGQWVHIEGEWDLLIAHPPCTFLTNAGAARLYRVIDGQRFVNWERFRKGMAAREVFMRIMNAECDRIAIENPKDTADYIGVVQVEDKAVITSGGYERFFEEDGEVYHHIIDPKTGYPAKSGLSSVTIVSDDGMYADGLSTTLFVMGKEEAVKLWKQSEYDFEMVLVTDEGDISITDGLKDSFSSEYEYEVIE